MSDIDQHSDSAPESLTNLRSKYRKVRLAIASAALAVSLTVILIVLGERDVLPITVVLPLAGAAYVLSVSIAVAATFHYRAIQQTATASRIERAEKRVEAHPEKPKAAWELAQVKLEAYLDRNIAQVQSIYWLTVFVMLVGFMLIGYGVVMVFSDPTANLKASMVSAASGILVNFIGASFLVVHRSTMSQAKDYVTILERINAVGMAIQIADTIGDADGHLRQETIAAVAKQILEMYKGTVTREGDT